MRLFTKQPHIIFYSDCHFIFHRCARGNGAPHFYHLIDFLYTDAQDIPVAVQLLSQRKLKKRTREKVKSNNAKLFKLWDSYKAADLTPTELLTKASRLVKS